MKFWRFQSSYGYLMQAYSCSLSKQKRREFPGWARHELRFSIFNSIAMKTANEESLMNKTRPEILLFERARLLIAFAKGSSIGKSKKSTGKCLKGHQGKDQEQQRPWHRWPPYTSRPVNPIKCYYNSQLIFSTEIDLISNLVKLISISHSSSQHHLHTPHFVYFKFPESMTFYLHLDRLK